MLVVFKGAYVSPDSSPSGKHKICLLVQLSQSADPFGEVRVMHADTLEPFSLVFSPGLNVILLLDHPSREDVIVAK